MLGESIGIDLCSISKTYDLKGGKRLEAVSSLTTGVADREFVCVVGPSGCGKSTLLKLISGIESTSAGEVRLSGQVVVSPRRDVGIVFQSANLLPWRTVMENILLPIIIYRAPMEPARRRARELVELVGLSGFEDAYPNELSGGMQQRVAIARALVHEPRYLLMDEPFGALDAMTRQVMNLELTRIWGADKKTVFLITHDIGEAIFLSDRILVMSARPGTVIEDIPVELPRPRALSIVTDPAYGALYSRVQKLLGLDHEAEAPRTLKAVGG